MCGRTACTLEPGTLEKACCYYNSKTKKYCKPKWKDLSNGGRSYYPSYNVAPTNVTPVLVAGKEEEQVIQPMVWGMIPPWHKGEAKSHGLSTNNCRIESLQQSKLYKPPFLKGQRCVVLCEGFYEWQTTKGKNNKQPYFIYAPQDDGVKIEDPGSWDREFDENTGWKGGKILKMAAIYSIWTSPEGEEIYSYSIITLESNETMAWLHHRMPAILDTDTAVAGWLDSGNIRSTESLVFVKPVLKLQWHPVSTLVNNSRNKDVSLNKPFSVSEEKPKKPTMLQQWLKGKGSSTNECEPDLPHKKLKPDLG